MGNFVIIAYLAGWQNWTADDILGDLLTHINYAFANVKNSEVVLDLENDIEKFGELHKVKEKYPHLKILLSVGGWTWSSGFHEAALTKENREKFAESALRLVKEYGFDGIDIDWEYPGQIGAGNPYGPEDKENFTLLIKKIREKLGDSYLLTIAAGANKAFIENTEMGKVSEYIDYCNLMTYDFRGEWNRITGHHTNLYASSYDPESISAEKAVKLFIDAGVPSEKIVLGCAFYGKGWNGVENANNGLYQKAQEAFSISYNKIKKLIGNEDFVRYWDGNACAPYLFNGNIFISYDDEDSIREKCKFVKKMNLGGVMFWEYSEDISGSLVKVMAEELL
ncbi:MAG TPA: glycoside hydrolase family 18 protein [Dictyoglomaceae bacterium]|nr:glycoside hydrolase family 18 protein [Dictyoglomaceae bacterium]